MFRMEHRYDILAAANSARFYLRHYARGIYPPASLHPLRLPVNRMFFPLRNPNGKCNYIRGLSRNQHFGTGPVLFYSRFLCCGSSSGRRSVFSVNPKQSGDMSGNGTLFRLLFHAGAACSGGVAVVAEIV